MSRFFLITVQGWGQMLGTFGSSEWGALLLSPRLFCNRAHWTDQKHDQFNLHRKSCATQPRWRIKLKCLKCNRGGTAKYHSQGALMGLVKSLQAIFSKQLYIHWNSPVCKHWQTTASVCLWNTSTTSLWLRFQPLVPCKTLSCVGTSKEEERTHHTGLTKLWDNVWACWRWLWMEEAGCSKATPQIERGSCTI